MTKLLQDLSGQLLALREEIEERELILREVRAEKATLQDKILAQLKKRDILSVKYQDKTISSAIRKTLKIVDEPTLLTHLKKHKLHTYIKETVAPEFDMVRKELVKTGETMPGLELNETEYVSIRSNDK